VILIHKQAVRIVNHTWVWGKWLVFYISNHILFLHREGCSLVLEQHILCDILQERTLFHIEGNLPFHTYLWGILRYRMVFHNEPGTQQQVVAHIAFDILDVHTLGGTQLGRWGHRIAIDTQDDIEPKYQLLFAILIPIRLH